ncbi:serine/threonine-protein kinase [Streptomyces lydicus]
MARAEPAEIFEPLESSDPGRVGAYDLVARLGAGGMGKVYLSYTPGGRPVALKVIRPELADDPEFRRRFRQEVAAAQQVHGLHTAPVIDSDTEGPQPWLATAFVPGPTLAAAVARHGPLSVPTVLLLAAGVAEALQAVHAAGIVHRDLKPSNVLLASDGPRVIDFGIARAADAVSLTATGVAVGTPAYMSPEQAVGGELGPATDIFSLGQLVAHAATGNPAYGDGPSHAVLYRIVHEEPDLTAVPQALHPLLQRCLAKDPDERPTPGEVVDICRAASPDNSLRRSGEWLPGSIATDLTRHQPALAPPACVRPPTPPSTWTSAPHAPTVSSVLPAVAPASRQGPPSHPWPSPPGPPVPHPAAGYLPTGATGATSPPGMPPVKRRGTKGLVAVVGALSALLLSAGGCAVLMSTVDRGDSAQAGGTGGVGTAKRRMPKPVSYPRIQLPDGYHLDFSGDPRQPKDSNYDDFYYLCDFSGCSVGSYNTKLVLLNNAEKGSLAICRATTRFTTQIEQKQLSRGSQICVRTAAGHIALLTYKGASADASPGRYLTFDAKLWRNAADPTQ